ncbi:uncharacterized protein B0H64DRAFT_390121 [Chaetomium fimeti]|uniref:WKF domain-containing protein n=1 Tax=Chaetomium fimeti TaxID=1854472 RepID=A0AAE0HHQ5_9PEZI|nr:hypothetical protein B0H64DRAFT_390121 [Chaetomium fimeti]
MSAHVPAWKRLGLKLKGPSSGEAIPSSAGPNSRVKPSAQTPNAHQTRANGSPASALKRKLPTSASTSNAVNAQTPNKKPRRENQSAAEPETPSSLRKSVSFADDTKDSAKEKAGPKKAKSKKAKKASNATKSDFSLEPSLSYIRQWHTARDSWKFNKNHQTLLIKYLFDEDKVPSADIPIFYQYIRDLKGFVRTRLRETAAETKKKDMEAGAGAFPATLKDKETKQKEYEETISRFLQDLQQHQQRRQSNSDSKNSNGKRTLDEVEYVLRVATPEIKQRLLKRIRAELVVDELSDSEESTTSEATGATPTGTSSSSASSGRGAAVADAATTGRSDGSQQPAKRRRLRNVRTAIDDNDSSSSESESGESGSEESSSESESEDEEMDMGVGVAAAESSSSSSSSSGSEAESEADSESEGESDSGSSGSDED